MAAQDPLPACGGGLGWGVFWRREVPAEAVSAATDPPPQPSPRRGRKMIPGPRSEMFSLEVPSPRSATDSASVRTSRPRARLRSAAGERSPRSLARLALFPTPPDPRPASPNRRLDRHDRGQTEKLPAGQVLEEIEQLAVPGDDPHLGRNRPILQGMSVDDGQAWIIFDSPA